MRNLKFASLMIGISVLMFTAMISCQKDILPEPQLSLIANTDSSKSIGISRDTTVKKEITVSTLETDNTKAGSISVDYLNTYTAQAGGSDYFVLKSNTSWKIASAPSWVTVSPMSGTGNSKVTVVVKENTGAQRTDAILISGTNVKSNVSINVLQLAPTNPGTIAVDYLNTFSASAGDHDYFVVTSNTSWKVTNAPSWVTVSPMSGTGNANVTVTVMANTGAQRTGTITVTASNNQTVSVNALQLGGTAAVAQVVTPTTTTPQIANYYVAVNGSDSNPGTIDKPFATWAKAYSVMKPGELTYIRGGLYTTNSNVVMTGNNGTEGNLIKLWAYPGETPILSPAAGFVNDWGIALNANYIHLKGLEITGFVQYSSPVRLAPGIYGLNTSNCVFEQLNLHHNAMGAYVKGNNNTYKNCDFHHNQDPYQNYQNGDGLEAYALTPTTTNSTTTITGCRAWSNADDGFDVSDCDANVVIDNCWSWGNGFKNDGTSFAGDGNGFKIGWTNGSYPTTVKRRLTNNLSWNNTGNGFDQNQADCASILFNNTSYNNGRVTPGTYGNYKYGFQFQYKNTSNIFKNNISYKSLMAECNALSNSIQDHNTWNSGYTVTDSDFASLDPSGSDGARASDGSLPSTSFLKLKSTSKLASAGVDVGLTFSGTAPNLGAR